MKINGVDKSVSSMDASDILKLNGIYYQLSTPTVPQIDAGFLICAPQCLIEAQVDASQLDANTLATNANNITK